MKKIQIFEVEGLRPMSNVELTNTFGGGWWQDFKIGFMEGWNWAKDAAAEIASILAIANKMRRA